MKRLISLALLTALAAFLLAGCRGKSAELAFTAENEIFSYTRTDPKKTQLVISMIGKNANVQSFAAAFEARNPDVQTLLIDITGGDDAYRPVVDWVVNGMAPDLMFVNPDSFIDDEQTTALFEDLSANPAIEFFEVEALNRAAVGGHVYFLPALSEINCMIYNRTLFERYGWSVPQSFDEFVALCKRIREDTFGAVQPWNPNAKYDSLITTALEAFSYAELFGGAENRGWYNDFCAGKAGFAGHMEPFYAMLQTLIDEKILLEEHFSYSATTRGKEFEAGQIAMINAPVSVIRNDEYRFDYMAYPSTDGELGYVNDYFNSVFGVPKKEHTDAERDAIDRCLLFFASAEGQRALIGDTLMVSNGRDVPLGQAETLSGIEAVIDQGHKFNRLDFPGAGERNWSFKQNALDMATGEKTASQIIAEIDEKPYKNPEEAGKSAAKVLAELREDFSVLEFSFYIADMYREAMDADIGLINHGVAYRGNLVRLFKGDMLDSYVKVLKPRSFANGSTLIKLSMSGRQIVEALNHPVDIDGVSNSVYAFSGLRCEIAPWNEPGKKYLSVKLSDGSDIQPDKLYSVAAWDGTVGAEYVTELLETREGSWEELMAAKLMNDKAPSPAKDGRVKLVWN